MESVLINLVKTMSTIEDPAIEMAVKYHKVRRHMRKFFNTIIKLKNNEQLPKPTKKQVFYCVLSKKQFTSKSMKYMENYFRKAILNGVLTYNWNSHFKTEQQLCQNAISDIFTKFKQLCDCFKCKPTDLPTKHHFCVVRLRQTSLITLTKKIHMYTTEDLQQPLHHHLTNIVMLIL